MRKVKVKDYNNDIKGFVIVEGVFHQWGYGYDEYEAGPGNYSIAIVELPDGRVIEVPPRHVTFLEE